MSNSPLRLQSQRQEGRVILSSQSSSSSEDDELSRINNTAETPSPPIDPRRQWPADFNPGNMLARSDEPEPFLYI